MFIYLIMCIDLMHCTFSNGVRLIAQVFLNSKPKSGPVPNISRSRDLTGDLHWLTEEVLQTHRPSAETCLCRSEACENQTSSSYLGSGLNPLWVWFQATSFLSYLQQARNMYTFSYQVSAEGCTSAACGWPAHTLNLVPLQTMRLKMR